MSEIETLRRECAELKREIAEIRSGLAENLMAMATGLCQDRVYRFESHAGESFSDQRAHWPHMLRLRMRTEDAWYVVNHLLPQLRRGESTVGVDLLGMMTRDSE